MIDTTDCQALRPLLIALLRSGLTGAMPPRALHYSLPDLFPSPEEMWQAMEALVYRHGCQSLFAEGCRVSRPWMAAQGWQCPALLLVETGRARLDAGARLIRARAQCRRLAETLSERGIEPVFLKGMLLAERCYRDPTLRPFGDVDLLVRPEHHEQAADALRDLGYRLAEGETTTGEFASNNFHAPYIQDGRFPVELHWDFTPSKSPVRIPLAEVWDRSPAVRTSIGQARVLAAEDEMIFLAIHVARHHFAAPIRSYFDFGALLEAYPGIDWSLCIARAEEWGAEADFAAVITTAAELGCVALPPAAELLLRSRLPRRMTPALLASYALAWPFIDLPYRLLDTAMGSSPFQVACRFMKLLFPSSEAVHETVSPANTPTRPNTLPVRAGSDSYAARWLARMAYWITQIRQLSRNRQSMSGALQIHRTLQDRHIMCTSERKIGA